MQRDSLDFKSMSVEKLFTKLLVPTIMGMAASALFTVVDGISSGTGLGVMLWQRSIYPPLFL